jgi:hypothetical protein
MNHLELQQTFLECYNLGDSYCRSLYEKGGVCILVHEKIKFVKIDLTKFCKDKDLEVCAVKVYLDSRNVCIIAIYRAPSGNFDFFIMKLDTILKKLFRTNVEFIICGDININFLVEGSRRHQLEAILKTYNLMSVVNFPTRIQHTTSTAIDNFFIDCTMVGNYSIKRVINGLSDHDAQVVTFHSFSLGPQTKKFMSIRMITEPSINDFLLKLSYETWDAVFSTENVNDMFNSFLDSYLKLFYSSFPLKRVPITNNKNNNWITLGILTSCKRKRELYLACRDNNNPALTKYYKKYCNILSVVIKKAKKLTYADKIDKSVNKNKAIWDVVKLETNKTRSRDQAITLNIEGTLVRNHQDIADEFNKYFLSIAKNIINDKNDTFLHTQGNNNPLHYVLQSFTSPFPNMNLKSVSSKEVEKIIKSLKTKNSFGYDGISTKLLKISSGFISSPLTHICNKSLSSGIFPDRLKYAVVKPLFKKGDRSNITNYRPISLLSSFSKVIEKIMYNQIQEHLKKYRILAEEQFGFREDPSTSRAIYKLINETLQALNNKSPVGRIFFYLEKAFDCLNHDILMSEL